MIAFNVFKGDIVDNVVIEKIDIRIYDLYKEICNEYMLSDNFDIKKILSNHNCKIRQVQDNKQISLVFFIIINEEKIIVNVYKVPNILIFSKTRYKKINVKGNCIDEFIIKGLYSELNSIDNYIDNIKSRKDQRKNLIEYHQTACYEHDFRSLCYIKNSIEKLLDNCNKEIKLMSDKYTKL